MNAGELYTRLERDFITPSMTDDWAQDMRPMWDFMCDNFRDRSMGLVCDNSQQIDRVYTAVDPSDEVMQSVLGQDETDAMLFVHHPMVWAIYNLHVPLDSYGEYCPSVTLGKTLGIGQLRRFLLSGALGTTELSTAAEMATRLEAVIGHRASLCEYGDDQIGGGVVALAPGGGLSIYRLEEVVKQGVNTFITGITARNDHSESAHQYAEASRINLLGGTHYSTEKFACQAMCRYFERLGLPAEFIEGRPMLEDL